MMPRPPSSTTSGHFSATDCLVQIMNTPSFPTADDKLLTKKQAAKRLAISIRTLDRMVAQRILTKVFIGKSPRFRKSDIDAVVANGI